MLTLLTPLQTIMNLIYKEAIEMIEQSDDRRDITGGRENTNDVEDGKENSKDNGANDRDDAVERKDANDMKDDKKGSKYNGANDREYADDKKYSNNNDPNGTEDVRDK